MSKPPSASTSAACASSSAARSAIRSRRCWSSGRRRRSSVHTQEHRPRQDAAGAAAHRRRRRPLHHRRHRHRARSRDRRLQRLLSPADAGRAATAPASSSISAATCGAAFERAQKKGQHLPVVVCIGSDLALHYTAATMGSQMPENADELAVAGGLCGRPLPVVKAVSQDLLVPAESEIVLEGVLKCDEEIDGRPVRRVRRLSGAGRSRRRCSKSPRVTHRDQADLSRHQRLRPRDRGAAQIRAGGEPAQGAAIARCRSSPTPR